mmetsp:Transcript_7995/g.24171  ORF Transcript_7995/g.24171 Transcript_7995/m.24171 type:complete len:363 (-) Transcript_7995:2284-3372(-)
MQVALLVDQEGLLIQVVRIAQRNLGDLRTIVIVQPVDVIHDTGLVSLDRSKDEQVLQVAVLAEVRGLVQHDLLQQLDQLVWKIRSDEGLDGRRDVLGIRRLRQGGADNLVDDLTPVLVLRVQHHAPQIWALALHQVARLQPVQAILVRHIHELLVARSPGALVGGVGEVRVTVLAVFAHGSRVVELVRLQERLRVAVRVDVDFSDAVVQERILVAFGDPRLEPGQQDLEPVPLLALGHQRLDGAGRADVLQQRLDEVFRAIKVNEGTDHRRTLQRVHLHNVDLDVLHERVLVEVVGELSHEAVQVADVDQRPRIRELRLLEEVLHNDRVVGGALAAHALHLLHVSAAARCLDVLEVNLRVSA